MLARGVPVDCVGHQMHINVESPSVAAIRTTLEAFAALGLDNQVTEMDISVYTDSTSRYQVVPEEILVQQGYRYRDIFHEYRRLRPIRIGSVTLWGLGDDNTWLKNFPIARLDLPLLFDEDLQAKHAYWGVVDPQRLPVLNQRANAVNGHGQRSASIRTTSSWGDRRPPSPFGGEDTVPATFKVAAGTRTISTCWSAWRTPPAARATASRCSWTRTTARRLPTRKTTPHYVFRRYRPGNDPVRFRFHERAGGYELDAAIPIARELALGAEVGFDVRVPDAEAQAVAAWNDFTLSQETDTSKFGTLVLIGPSRSAQVRRGTPVVDGVVDPLWAGATEIETATWVLGTSGATARVKRSGTPSHLYVLAQVTDPLLSTASANPWEEDSIEVFLDQNNGKTSSYQADDGQFRVNYENTQSFGGSAGAGPHRQRHAGGAGRLRGRGGDRVRRRRARAGNADRVRLPGERRRAGQRRAQQRGHLERPDRTVVPEHVTAGGGRAGAQAGAPGRGRPVGVTRAGGHRSPADSL